MTRFVGTPLRGIEFANNGDEAISTRIVGDAHAKIRIDAGGRITWSSGDSAGDTNLYRDEANVLKTDDVFIGAGGIVTIATNGAPSQELANGAVAVDITNNVFYFRSDDEWIKVANSDDATSITISTTEPESPVNGELWFDSDDELLKIYNSGSWVNLTGAKKLDDLSDVDLTVLPLDGDVLKYNSSASVWVSGSVAAGGGATVTISDNPPEEPDNGDLWFESDSLDLYIYYNDAFLQLTDTSSGVTDITDLSDVQIDNPLIGQVLVYDGADWINETLSASVSNINDIGNVQITSASVSQVLQFDGTNWVNTTFSGGASDTDELPEGLVNLYFTAARVLSALPQDISASASPTFATVNADLSGNATTATALETSRTISLSGDVSGSASFDGTSDITISTTVAGGGSGLTDTDDLPEGSVNLYFSEERVILALPQDISASASPTFSTVNADLSGNALTSTSLETARSINLGGDLSGSASFDGTTDITITASVGADAVELGVNTTGNYVSDVTAGTGVSVSHTPGEGSSPTISIGQDVSSSASVTFSQVSANLLGNVTGDLTGNADTATTLETPRTISISGDVSGSVSFDGSSDVAISATIQPDSVALGTDTTGEYMLDVVAGLGISVVHTQGEGSTASVSLDANLDDLNDVDVPFAQNGQLLEFDGTGWVNAVRPSGEPIGHENKVDSLISFDEITRTFSISPVDAKYTVWCKGLRFVKTGTETVTIPDTSGLYFIYFDADGVLSYSTSPFDWENDTPTAYVYWNATDYRAYLFADERHGITLDWATHEYLHRTRGAAIADGFGANNVVLGGNGSSDDHAKLDITNGTFFDEDLQVDVTHSATPTPNTWEQVLQGGAEIPVFYRINNHWVKDTATKFPLKQGVQRPQYNLNTGGTWSTTDVSNNGFGISFIIATNNLNEPVIAVLGQASYGSKGAAEASFYESLDLSGFPVVEFRPLYKVVYECKTSFANTPKAAFVALTDLRSIISGGLGIPSSTAIDHGNLTGLSDDDHPQYLTDLRHDALDHSTAMGSVVLDDISNVNASSPVSGDFIKWNGSAWVNDAITLGTDTEGNYLVDVVGGTGVIITHTPGEGSSASIAIGQDVGTSASVSFAQIQTTGDVVIGGDLTVNGNTTTLNTETLIVEDNIIVLNGNVTGSPVLNAGIEIERGDSDNVQLRWNESTDSWEVTEDGTTYKNIAVGQDVETSSSVTFAHVYADVTGDLTGNADTASMLETSRTISLSGDVSGSVSFNGGSDVTITTEIQPNSIALGTDTTGTYLTDVVGQNGIIVVTEPMFPTDGFSASIELSAELGELKDVYIPSPVSGDFLKYDGIEWVNSTISLGADTDGNYMLDVVAGSGITVAHTPGEGSSASIELNATLDDLTDVNAGTPADGQFLQYVSASSAWVAADVPTINTLDDIGDVSVSSASAGQFLKYDGADWIPDSIVGGASISGSAPESPTEGQLWFDSDTAQTFVYYDSQWIEIGVSGTAISVSEAAPSSPVNGQLWFNSASGGTFVYYGSASVWVEIGAAQVDNLLNLIDNKGDLLVGISDGALNSVPIGSDGQILVANSSASVGVEWQTPDYASTGKSIAMAIVFSG